MYDKSARLKKNTIPVQQRSRGSVSNYLDDKRKFSNDISYLVDERPKEIEARESNELFKGSTEIKKNNFQSIAHYSSPQPIIQRRFSKNNISYSFLSAFDIEGNPYLASNENGVNKNWKISTEQRDISLEVVDDLHNEITAENQDTVYHNLSMGREQRIKYGDQKAILLPFKSYTFSPDTVSDVAVYNVDESGVQKAKFYYNYHLEFLDIIDGLSNQQNAMKNFKMIKSKMMPLIIGEDYRTKGALSDFEKLWSLTEDCFCDYLNMINQGGTYNNEEPATKKARKEKGITAKKEKLEKLKKLIRELTEELPWAGKGGKLNYRASREDHYWHSESRSVNNRSVSPDKTSTGGKWVKENDEKHTGSKYGGENGKRGR